MSDSLGPYELEACQAPLSMKFSRQEYQSGLPFPSPGDLSNLVFCIAGRFFTIWATREACNKTSTNQKKHCAERPAANSSIFRLCDHQSHFVKQPYLLDLNWWQIAESQQLSVGNGNPLQYSCLENSIDRRAWQATVHEAPKSRTCLSDWHFDFFCCMLFTKSGGQEVFLQLDGWHLLFTPK